jgi:hypothetical protein
MSFLARRARPNSRADLGLAGKLTGSKGAVGRVFCLRMVGKTGKGGPQLLAAWPQERAEV